MYNGPFDWNPFIPFISDFLHRQTLEELYVVFFDSITPPLLALFVSCTLKLSFYHVGGSFQDGEIESSIVPKLVQLQVLESDGINQAFSSEDFAHCTSDLRRLGLAPHPNSGATLISAAAHTLEHRHFKCNIGSPLWEPLPPLPALRSVDLAVQTKWPQHPSWLVTALSSIIASSHATIKQINILYHVSPGPFLLPFFDTDISAQLNKVLSDAAHPLRICWQLRFERAKSTSFTSPLSFGRSCFRFAKGGILLLSGTPSKINAARANGRCGKQMLVDTAMYSHIS
ncbi:hypothetical protein C8R43DRAFT_1107526 [Mycena crocata]|nr:hypothetical protein C8R43DRAFT_1107526 [Mycena crocata]